MINIMVKKSGNDLREAVAKNGKRQIIQTIKRVRCPRHNKTAHTRAKDKSVLVSEFCCEELKAVVTRAVSR